MFGLAMDEPRKLLPKGLIRSSSATLSENRESGKVGKSSCQLEGMTGTAPRSLRRLKRSTSPWDQPSWPRVLTVTCGGAEKVAMPRF